LGMARRTHPMGVRVRASSDLDDESRGERSRDLPAFESHFSTTTAGRVPASSGGSEDACVCE
jgi:hypothetical protein